MLLFDCEGKIGTTHMRTKQIATTRIIDEPQTMDRPWKKWKCGDTSGPDAQRNNTNPTSNQRKERDKKRDGFNKGEASGPQGDDDTWDGVTVFG